MLKSGTYVNKRRELVELKNDDNSYYLCDSKDENRRYDTKTGICYVWYIGLERWVMDTDLKSDLVMGQAQDSLTEQIDRVVDSANRAGEYDAADWIRKAYLK